MQCYYTLHFESVLNYVTTHFIFWTQVLISVGVTLAQLVKESVGQADVQRFNPHLRHN